MNGKSNGKRSLALTPLKELPPPEGPVLVCILDGFGENEFRDEYNAVYTAKSPVFDRLREVPGRWRTVKAHGTAVGLPSDADMGNSEVGHNALGSGQVCDQGARLVDIAIENGKMFEGNGWKLISEAFADHTVHFIGLLSDGGVHSRYDQLLACMQGAVKRGAKRIRVHALLDGRDVPDGSSKRFVQQLEKDMAALGEGVDAKIASGGGRMIVTMDRYEADWNIVKRGWDAHVLGKAPNKFKDALTALKTLRGTEESGVTTDQYLEPFVIVDEENNPVGTVEDHDAVVLFNFRSDRMVQMSKAFEYEDFNVFDRERYPKDLKFVGMMQYDGDLLLPKNFLVPPPEIDCVSGQYLCANKLSTFACSETQKFGHVTFFWNGNRSGYINSKYETYLEIPSDKIAFNLKPAMKAAEITEACKEAIKSGKYQMVRLNYPNPDMVGHTGDLKAAIFACELCDKLVGELIEAVDSVKGRYLITADHGNSDDMVQRKKKSGQPMVDEETGRIMPLTSHTLAPVPVVIGGAGLPDNVVFDDTMEHAGLANVTATYLNFLGYEAPDFYEKSLLKFK